MKKIPLRSSIWSLLIITSLAAYTYLNCFTTDIQATYGINQESRIDNDDERDSKVFLPDIALIKKILNITKMVIPRD